MKYRTIVILLSLMILLEIVMTATIITGYSDIENRVSVLDGHLWKKYLDAIHDPIIDDYPLSSYLKDSLINMGLYRDRAMVLLGLLFAVTVGLILVHMKKQKTDETVNNPTKPKGE